MKPATRARSGQPRNLDGRFIRSGSKEVVAAPVQAKSRVAVAAKVVASGSKCGAAVANLDLQVPARVVRNQDATLTVAAVELVQQVAEEDDEVSGSDSEECVRDSTSRVSESDNEEGEDQEEQQGLGSSLADVVGGKLADQLFDDMPQSVPSAAGRNLGGAAAVGTSSKARTGAALVIGAVGPKGKAKLVEVRSVLARPPPVASSEKLGGDVPVKAHVGAVGAVPKSPWVHLFKDNRNPGKGIMLEDRDVDGDIVMLDEEDVDVVEEAWGFCLVGLFAGKFPGMAAVHKLCEGWKVKCSQWRHRSGWIIFKFQSDEDRLNVLNGGPYFVYGSNLLLKIMPSCFRFEGEDVSSVPIWIQLPGLPLDCWNARALSKIVSKVGKPITTDKMTLTKERFSFARVLVEVDVTSDIVSEVEIGLPTGVVYHQSVIPEFTPKFCKKCKIFGHEEATCGKGLEERQHKVYVAKKKGRSDTSVVELRVGPCLRGHMPPDQAREKIQDWLMSGPKVVQDAAVPKVGPVPNGTRVKEVLSAFATALGVTVEFPGAASSADLGDGIAGSSDVERSGGSLPAQLGEDAGAAGISGEERSGQEGAGLLPALAEPGAPPTCPVVGLVSSGQGAAASGKGKKKKKAGQRDAPAAQPQSEGEDFQIESSPYDGLEASFEGWNKGGKKGKRK